MLCALRITMHCDTNAIAQLFNSSGLGNAFCPSSCDNETLLVHANVRISARRFYFWFLAWLWVRIPFSSKVHGNCVYSSSSEKPNVIQTARNQDIELFDGWWHNQNFKLCHFTSTTTTTVWRVHRCIFIGANLKQELCACRKNGASAFSVGVWGEK